MGKTQTSKIFRFSRNTINLWLQKREEGDYRAEDGYQRGYGAKIPDLEKFKQFARKHGNQTRAFNAAEIERPLFPYILRGAHVTQLLLALPGSSGQRQSAPTAG